MEDSKDFISNQPMRHADVITHIFAQKFRNMFLIYAESCKMHQKFIRAPKMVKPILLALLFLDLSRKNAKFSQKSFVQLLKL